MFKRFSPNYMALLLLLDGLFLQLSLWLAMQFRYILPYGQAVRPEWIPQWVYAPTIQLYMAVGVLWLAAFLFSSVYTPRRIVHWYEEYQRILLAHTVAALSLAGVLYLANIELPRLTYLYFYLLALTALIGYRSIVRFWHRLRRQNAHSVAQILLVGAGDLGQRIVEEFRHQAWPGLAFVGFLDDDPRKQGMQVVGLPVLGSLDRAETIIAQYGVDEVIIALPPRAHNRLANLVANLHRLPVRVRVVPDYFPLSLSGATVENLGGIPLIGLRDPAIDGFQRLVKRLLDMGIAGVGLLVILPLLLVVAAAIKWEDGDPVFYRARRIGENGRHFGMIKFRSMVVNADQMLDQVSKIDAAGNLIHKNPDDPRVTRVGRFLRRTSLDEVPQLWNVLIGEMSLVGPRPELPDLVEKYEPWQRKRFAVPQGITGWWQVNGRSDKPMHLHSEDDLYYIQNYSLWLDIQILWKTIFVVARGRGAF